MKVLLDIEDCEPEVCIRILTSFDFVKDVLVLVESSYPSHFPKESDCMLTTEPILLKDWMKKEEIDVWENL